MLVAWAAMGAHAATLLLTGQRAAVRAAVRAAPAIGLLSAPMVSYTALAFALDPALRQWGAQNVIRSPHPLHYLLAYGLLLIPAAVGLRRLWRRDRFRAAFLAGWVAVLPLLLYAPYNLNRRFAEGFFAALAALAVLGLWPPSLRLRPLLPSSFFPPSSSSLSSSSREAFLLPAKRSFFLPSSSFLLPSSFFLLPSSFFFLFALPSTALLLAGGFAVTARPAAPIFLPADELAAFAWLADPAHARPGNVALAAFETGNALPAYAPLVSYIGHGPETIFLAQKLPRVRAFFRAGTPEAERRALLADGRVRYVIHGPAEAALGNFDPAGAPYLRRAASFGDYNVYEVLP